MSLFIRESLPAIAIGQTYETPFSRTWLWLNLASLDAPLVALSWQLLLQKCLGLTVNLETSIALMMSVWFIYVSDRLLDALSWRSEPLAPRHMFYRRHWHPIACAAVASLLFLGWLCGHLHPFLLQNGMLLLCAVGIYFLTVHLASPRYRKLWPKEIVVGVIFSFGTFLSTWTEKPEARFDMLVPITIFAALCALNCMAIEYWEWRRYQPDSDDLPHRLTTWAGAHLAVISLGAAAASFFCLLAGPVAMRSFYVSAALSFAALFFLATREERVSVELLRVLADVALLTPVLAGTIAVL